MIRRRPIYATVLRLALLLAVALAALPATQRANIALAQGTITLRIQSAREWVPAGLPDHYDITADPNSFYTWVIVRDDVGETAPNYGGTGATDCKAQSIGGPSDYPANCQWPSIKSSPGGTAGEIVYQGDKTQLNEGTSLSAPLSDGKYMISILVD